MTTGANRQKIMTARACVFIFCSHVNFCPAHFSTSSSCWSDVCHVLHLTPVITISTCHPPVLHSLFGLCLHIPRCCMFSLSFRLSHCLFHSSPSCLVPFASFVVDFLSVCSDFELPAVLDTWHVSTCCACANFA